MFELLKTDIRTPPVAPTVRFNDIHGNAYAGLRVGPTQKTPTQATCNYWGSDRGPSGIAHGPGDAILVQPGAPAPVYVPFAKAPIAESDRTTC